MIRPTRVGYHFGWMPRLMRMPTTMPTAAQPAPVVSIKMHEPCTPTDLACLGSAFGSTGCSSDGQDGNDDCNGNQDRFNG